MKQLIKNLAALMLATHQLAATAQSAYTGVAPATQERQVSLSNAEIMSQYGNGCSAQIQ